MERAVDHVNAKIAPGIIGMNVFDQAALDTFLIGLDGTGIIKLGSQCYVRRIHGNSKGGRRLR